MDDEFELNGLRFRATIEHDDSMGEPWKEHDGHGVVSEWRRDFNGYGHPAKAAHERIVSQDQRHAFRTYDVEASMKIALKDNWGRGPEWHAAFTDKHGRAPTKREEAAAAVDADFERLRAWCNDEWSWIGIVVTLLDVEGKPTDECESLWGIESDSDDYLEEVARELADQIAHRVGDAMSIPARPSAFVIREEEHAHAHE